VSRASVSRNIEDSRAWLGDQSVHFEQHWTMFDEVLRVSIKRNVHDFQSYAKVEIWSPNNRNWGFLCSIPIQALDCRAVTYVRDPNNPADRRLLEASCAELISKARLILSHAPAPNRA
jgi:hypothetical protein